MSNRIFKPLQGILFIIAFAGIVMMICRHVLQNESYISRWLINNVPIYNNDPIILMNQGLLLLNAESENVSIESFENDSMRVTENIRMAHRYFMKADSISESNYAKYAIGILEYCMGDIFTAINTLKQIVINDVNPEVAYVLGRIYEKQNMVDEAINVYVSMFCARPDIFEGEFYNDLSKRTPALADSIRTLVIKNLKDQYIKNNNDIIIGARLAKCLIEAGEYEQSKYLLQTAINKLPNMNRPYLYMGDILWDEGNYADAENYYVKSYVLDQNDIICNDRIFHRLGVPKKNTITHFKQAISIQLAYGFSFTSNSEILKNITDYLSLRNNE